MQRTARLSLITKILTTFTLVISLSVLYGWIFNDVSFVKLGPRLPPMVFNTGLFFSLLTFNIFLDRKKYFTPLTLMNVVILIFSLMTIAEYSIPANFGIDELFFKDNLHLDLTHPGRMGPNTAFGFIIFTIAFLFKPIQYERFRLRNMFPMVFFIFTILVGVMSLFGFIFSAERGYIWGSFTRMAIQTGGCFLFFGISCLIENVKSLSYLNQIEKETKQLITIVILTVIGATLGLWFLFCTLDAHKVREIIKSENGHLHGNTLISLKNTLGSLERVGRRLEAGDLTAETWRVEADQFVKHFDGLESLSLINRKGEIVYSASDSLTGDEIKAQLRMTPLHVSLLRAIDIGKPLYSPGVIDHQGHGGFFGIIPIYQYGTYDGALIGYFRGSKFFKHITIGLDHYITLKSGDVTLFSNIEPTTSIIPEWGFKSLIEYEGLELTTMVIPAKKIISSHLGVTPTIVLVIGVFLSILMAAFIAAIYELRVARNRHAYDSQWQRAILNGTDVGIVSTDIEGNIVLINPAALKIIGRTEEEVTGKLKPFDWHDQEEIAKKSLELTSELGYLVPTGMGALFAKPTQGLTDRGRWRIFRKDGEPRQINLSVHALRSSNGDIDGFLGVMEDITEIEKQHELFEEQRMKMVASSKMSALGEMAAGVAHEINNPLTVIKGMAKMIQMTTESERVEPSVVKHSAQTIENTVNRIAKIIGGLKTFARDSSQDELSVVKVTSILDETIPFCAERFKNENIDLKINYDHSIELSCRPVQISQVILNLLNNAHDAIAEYPEKWVEISVSKTPQRVEISVTDSGAGISHEVVEKMMQPFFTTKAIGKGTGLGLSISAGIIESHQGRLYYDRDSRNTRFVVELPLTGQS